MSNKEKRFMIYDSKDKGYVMQIAISPPKAKEYQITHNKNLTIVW
jgi:hypothetical protein